MDNPYTITMNGVNCPRCAGSHDGLEFKKLSSVVSTKLDEYWATCPSTKEPIIAEIDLA